MPTTGEESEDISFWMVRIRDRYILPPITIIRAHTNHRERPRQEREANKYKGID
jgi:hypothetical protein